MSEQEMMGVVVGKEQYSERFQKELIREAVDIQVLASRLRADESRKYIVPNELRKKWAWYKRQSL
jgi:hypothetical protein